MFLSSSICNWTIQPTESNRIQAIVLNIVFSTFLELNKSPSSRLWIVNVLRNPCHSYSVSNKLDFVLHSSRQLIRLYIPIDMDFLRATSNDEDGYVSWFEHSRREDVHMPDVEYPSV